MRSYINTLADYREAPFEREVTISCPESHVQAQMRHLTRRFKKTEPADVLRQGDVVTLSLESSLEKFNRSGVFVTVGGGLFHRGLEEALLGHAPGDAFTAKVDGEPVKVMVTKAVRTVFPEPTDEMAAAYAKEHEEYADCTTVEAYRDHVAEAYREEKKRGALYGAVEQIIDWVLTHSDWEFDEEELAELTAAYMKEVRQELAETGKEFEKLTKEELEHYFEVDSREETEEMMRSMAERQIAGALWRGAVKGVELTAASLEELEEIDWDFLEDFVNENLTMREEI